LNILRLGFVRPENFDLNLHDFTVMLSMLVVGHSGSALVVSINEVNLRRARLVLRWMTVSGFNSRCGTFISVCNHPPRSTQPGHPFVVSTMSTSQRAVMSCGWGVQAGMLCVCVWGGVPGWQVKLCDPLVTHGPYLSALEMQRDKAKCYTNLHYFTLLYSTSFSFSSYR